MRTVATPPVTTNANRRGDGRLRVVPRAAVVLCVLAFVAAACTATDRSATPTPAAGTTATPRGAATPAVPPTAAVPSPAVTGSPGATALPSPASSLPPSGPPLVTLPPPAEGTPGSGATLPPLPDEPVVPVPPATALTSQLQRLLEEWLSEDGAPGAVLGVRLPDGTTAIVAAGETDAGRGRAVDAGYRFRIGSITKTFVAVLIMQLVEGGRVALDDPISSHLPEARVTNGATIRQLLDHTSGIPDFAVAPEYRLALLRAPGRAWQPQEVLRLVEDRAPDFAPGAGWRYSNTNYVLLGMLAEQITGVDLAQLLRQDIYQPLGLESTHLDGLEPGPGPAVSGHFDLDSDGNPDNVRAIPYTALVTSGAAAGGISASALDVLDFGTALFGSGLVTSDSLAAMTTIAPPAIAYGAGMARFDQIGPEVWGHSGALPGFSTQLVHAVGEDVTIVAMANETGADVGSLVGRALALAREPGE